MKLREITVSYKLTDIDLPVDDRVACSEDVARIFRHLEDADREKFCVLHVSARNKILAFEVVSVGSLTASIVEPREVFKSAIVKNAVALIFVHNHPSGETSPSQADKDVTKALQEGGRTLNMKILDHIIIGHDGEYYSFADSGLI